MEYTELSEDINVDLSVTMWPSDIGNIESNVLQRVSKKLEGVCGDYGYVKTVRYIDNIESDPLINCMSGSGEFNISFTAHITRFLPEIGQDVVCKITGSEPSMGAHVSNYHPFIIFILSERVDEDGFIESTDDIAQIGDMVRVRILEMDLKKGDSSPKLITSIIEKM
jgi:DNA-directed RNA polymerase subunit E'/Rpb7